jgi:xanthine dehydrogenase molybdopterin-binding subunit B
MLSGLFTLASITIFHSSEQPQAMWTEDINQVVCVQVMQVVARELGISLEEVSVRPTDSIANANSNASGGSITSELCCMVCIVLCGGFVIICMLCICMLVVDDVW